MKTAREKYLSVVDPTQIPDLKAIVKTEGEECRKEYGEMQHFRPSAGLPNTEAESKEETKKNLDKWFNKPKPVEDNKFPLIEIFGLMNAFSVTEMYEMKCDCEMCLMMCETYKEYNVTNKALGLEHIDMDDHYMLHFDCNNTRDLNHFVKLPKPADEKTVFDH